MIMSNYALRVMGDGKNGNIGADGGWGKKIEAHESEKIWRAQIGFKIFVKIDTTRSSNIRLDHDRYWTNTRVQYLVNS